MQRMSYWALIVVIKDPMAEGVLVLGVGKGCKELSNYLKGTKVNSKEQDMRVNCAYS